MPSINVKIISLVLVLSIVGVTSGLKCFQCGQYHDGVGSITPCFNSTPTLPVFLKDCSRSSQKFCIVSERQTDGDCGRQFGDSGRRIRNSSTVATKRNYSAVSSSSCPRLLYIANIIIIISIAEWRMYNYYFILCPPT